MRMTYVFNTLNFDLLTWKRESKMQETIGDIYWAIWKFSITTLWKHILYFEHEKKNKERITSLPDY